MRLTSKSAPGADWNIDVSLESRSAGHAVIGLFEFAGMSCHIACPCIFSGDQLNECSYL